MNGNRCGIYNYEFIDHMHWYNNLNEDKINKERIYIDQWSEGESLW